MPGSTFGKLFRISTWGESHGKGVGVVIDGCPPGIPLDESLIQPMMDRRKPGSSIASTKRKEPDKAIIMSGVFEGMSTGTPIMIMLHNKDADSSAYKAYAELYRPGHGDITYDAKYGFRDWRGGGRASARETAARVAAGAVAKAILEKENISVLAYTIELGGIRAEKRDFHMMNDNMLLCPDEEAAAQMEKRVDAVRKRGDSLGGIVEIVAKGVPSGLGDPVFDKLDAKLAGALMSIGAVKGVEIGAGFEAARMLGSENNDAITPTPPLIPPRGGNIESSIRKEQIPPQGDIPSSLPPRGGNVNSQEEKVPPQGGNMQDEDSPFPPRGGTKGGVSFATNNSGGILAGISNGDDIVARVAVKPIPSISIEQNTVDRSGNPRTLSVKGRHDISAIPRINVVCEAMVCLVLADHLLRQKAIS